VPMNDDAAPDLPLFLSNEADEAKQRSFPIRKMVLVILAALAVEAAVLALGYPVARLAAVSASLTDALAPDKDEAAPPAQAEVDAQASPPSESEAATDQRPTATAQPATVEPAAPALADQQQAKNKAASGALFTQFQAWAQRQDGKPDTPQDPGQGSQAQVTQDAPAQPAPPKQSAESGASVPARTESAAPAPVRTVQKLRPPRELRNARAEMEAAEKARAKAAHAQHGAPTRAMEDAHTQEPPPQSSQTPSLLQLFGWR
jgi:hypothetical protein